MAMADGSGVVSAFHRQIIEDEIERLIAMLDAIDGDPDAEPSLGSTATACWTSQEAWSEGNDDDGENGDDDLEEDFRQCTPVRADDGVVFIVGGRRT